MCWKQNFGVARCAGFRVSGLAGLIGRRAFKVCEGGDVWVSLSEGSNLSFVWTVSCHVEVVAASEIEIRKVAYPGHGPRCIVSGNVIPILVAVGVGMPWIVGGPQISAYWDEENRCLVVHLLSAGDGTQEGDP